MPIRYAKKPLSEHLKALRDSAVSSAIRAGEVGEHMPEGTDLAKAHLSTAASLFLRARDSFSDADENLGGVFNAVAGIEIIRAAIAAAEAVEAGDVEANALPNDFIDICEKYGASPVTLFGGGADSSELRCYFYNEYFLNIETLFDRDGRPGATFLQVSSGVSFERAFNRGIVAYSGGKVIPLFGTAAEVIGEIIDEVEDCAAL